MISKKLFCLLIASIQCNIGKCHIIYASVFYLMGMHHFGSVVVMNSSNIGRVLRL